MAKKNFVFTNENLYDQNIFGGVYPAFREALISDKGKDLYSAVEQYFYLTQHFYKGKKSDAVETALFEAQKDMFSAPADKRNIKAGLIHEKKREVAKLKLRKIWKVISNHLDNDQYFKKSFHTGGSSYAVPTKQ